MKRVIFTVVTLAFLGLSINSAEAQTSVWDGTHTTWTNGTGTETDPYLIETAQQLAYLAVYVNNGTDAVENVVGSGEYWKLTTDIDLNSLSWTPIGFYNSDDDFYDFGGHFDGNGHTIANLVANAGRAGLFGRMNSGSVKNIGIVGNSSVTGSSQAGGIIGWATGTVIIDNCYNTGSVSSTMANAGGIIGCITYCNITINNCYNTGEISSTSSDETYSHNAGGIIGLVGDYSDVTINNCYNDGEISASASGSGSTYSYSQAGGMIGNVNHGTITIEHCSNNVYISASASGLAHSYAGGMIGRNYSYYDGTTINNCYNTGNIYGASYAGGIVGDNYYGIINNCYNTGDISASSAGGIAGYTEYNVTVNKSYNSGNISGNYGTGGIVGYSYSYVTINNCYNVGNIMTVAAAYAAFSGGIVGVGCVIISNCYNVGDISASGSIPGVGGIVGEKWCNDSDVSNSYYLDTSVSEQEEDEGTPQTAEFMKTQEFVDLLNNGPEPNSAYTLDVDMTNDGFPILISQTPSTDATLSTLTISEGELTPEFSSDIYNYTVDVPYSVTSLTITATATDPAATVVGTGEKQLSVGVNPFTITVTAADGVTKLDYTVTVNRADDVAIVETDNYPSLQIYPNPVNYELKITNYEGGEVQIFDLMGRRVATAVETGRAPSLHSTPETAINVSHLPSGMYFIKIGEKTAKFVKQ